MEFQPDPVVFKNESYSLQNVSTCGTNNEITLPSTWSLTHLAFIMRSDLVHRKQFFLKGIFEWNKYNRVIELSHSEHFVVKNMVFWEVGRHNCKLSIFNWVPHPVLCYSLPKIQAKTNHFQSQISLRTIAPLVGEAQYIWKY